MSHGATYLFLSEVTRGAEHCRDVSPLISFIIRTKDRRIPRKHLLAFTRHVRRGGLVRSIFFLWRPYSKVPHRVPTGPCVRRFCGRAYETANRLISIRPRCYFCTCRPYVHMWGRSTYQTQPGLRVRAGVPRGAQRTVSRPLSSRLACLGIKLKFQANLWTGNMGGS